MNTENGPEEPTFDPNIPFTLTGGPAPTAPERLQFLRYDGFADGRLVELMADAINVILSALRYTRGLPSDVDPGRFALQQLTISTAAVAAAEAEALLSLTQLGLSSTAWIHLRTIGECDLRLRAYRRDTAFALRVFRSLVASQRDAARFISDETINERLSELLEQATETASDRQLTGRLLSEEQQAAAIMQKHEWHAWSKWSHAEIIALGGLANRITAHPDDTLHRLITDDGRSRFQLTRGISFLLAILASLAAIGIDVFDLFNRINERFTSIAREYGILDEGENNSG